MAAMAANSGRWAVCQANTKDLFLYRKKSGIRPDKGGLFYIGRKAAWAGPDTKGQAGRRGFLSGPNLSAEHGQKRPFVLRRAYSLDGHKWA